MKKKTLALAMMVGLAVLVIGGCSKPADDSTATGTAGAAAGGTTTGTTTAGATTTG